MFGALSREHSELPGTGELVLAFCSLPTGSYGYLDTVGLPSFYASRGPRAACTLAGAGRSPIDARVRDLVWRVAANYRAPFVGSLLCRHEHRQSGATDLG